MVKLHSFRELVVKRSNPNSPITYTTGMRDLHLKHLRGLFLQGNMSLVEYYHQVTCTLRIDASVPFNPMEPKLIPSSTEIKKSALDILEIVVNEKSPGLKPIITQLRASLDAVATAHGLHALYEPKSRSVNSPSTVRDIPKKSSSLSNN
jgi:hypothetical protein